MTSPSDDFYEALRPALQKGTARLLELTVSGFDSVSKFDINWLRQKGAENRLVSITSLGTDSEYWLLPLPNTGDDTSIHAIHVGSFGSMLEEKNWRKLKIVRGDRGQISVRPGW